nr:hypothetical protein [Candidatus Sigynarchaeota archaeon]
MIEGKTKPSKFDELYEEYCKEQERLDESRNKLAKIEKQIDGVTEK